MTVLMGGISFGREKGACLIWLGSSVFALMVPRNQWKHLLAISLAVSAKEFIGHKHDMLS